MIFSLREFLSINFLFYSLSFASAVVLITAHNLYLKKYSVKLDFTVLLISYTLVSLISNLILGPKILLLFPLTLGLIILFVSRHLFADYSLVGRYFFISNFLFILSYLLWSAWFVLEIPISTTTRVLMLLSAPLIVFILPSGLMQFLEQFDILCRKNWIRPRLPFPITPRDYYPKVSLHVPTYAEPPELVIDTLNILSKIDYPNFEVLLIDNNTKDENLWKPVQAYCQRLGSRFRFFHINNLPGAKAGALNFTLAQTAPDAELIGVIDSDYHADPNFLKVLIGYFDDPKIGFVQTPHDYRDWEDNAYLRMCYFEYKIFFHTTMVSCNERDAAITVGTMCLIRRKALEETNGWVEWCATEDSELAIRIHAIGYSSVFITTTFGRGLIPETFSGYKKQRFRWTAGPVQELKHHFNLLMLWPWRENSLLSLAQRIHHLNHGLSSLNVGLGFLLTPVGLAVVASMVLHREVIHVPLELWLGVTVIFVSGIVLNWLLYKVAIGCSLRDTIGAILARKALSFTTAMAGLHTVFNSNLLWQRTSKFKVLPIGLGTLSSAKVELSLGLIILIFSVAAFLLLPFPGLLLMLLIGMLYKSFDYLTAPLLALLSEQGIKRSSNREFRDDPRIA